MVSCLARVEVPSAIWRKQRLGELSVVDAELLVAVFEADYHGSENEPERFAVVALPPPVLDEAAELCAVLGLRAYDAVQLASAVAARRAAPDCGQFACFDDRLRDAAARSGFTLIPGA